MHWVAWKKVMNHRKKRQQNRINRLLMSTNCCQRHNMFGKASLKRSSATRRGKWTIQKWASFKQPRSVAITSDSQTIATPAMKRQESCKGNTSMKMIRGRCGMVASVQASVLTWRKAPPKGWRKNEGNLQPLLKPPSCPLSRRDSMKNAWLNYQP